MISFFYSVYACIFTGTWYSPSAVRESCEKTINYFIFGDNTLGECGFFEWLGQVLSHNNTSHPATFWQNLRAYATSVQLWSLTQPYVQVICAVLSVISVLGIVFVMYKILKWAITSWVYKLR